MKCLFRMVVLGLASCIPRASAEDSLAAIAQLAQLEPKPFVIVEGSHGATQGRGQGVVISSTGLVLSCGHVTWIDNENSFTNSFRVSFRGSQEGKPAGAAHIHTLKFTDREGATFFEHFFPADLLMQGESRFVAGADLAVFQIASDATFPKLDFFSQEKPSVKSGDILQLCHYTFPNQQGDPFFLISPVEVVGVAQTSSGFQYLGKGYYRVGSSGGAILKNGRLIGIQSSAYTVNAKNIGEIPLGLISFQLVWAEMFRELSSPTEKGVDSDKK